MKYIAGYYQILPYVGMLHNYYNVSRYVYTISWLRRLPTHRSFSVVHDHHQSLLTVTSRNIQTLRVLALMRGWWGTPNNSLGFKLKLTWLTKIFKWYSSLFQPSVNFSSKLCNSFKAYDVSSPNIYKQLVYVIYNIQLRKQRSRFAKKIVFY